MAIEAPDEDIRLAGPRLAIKVAELIKAAYASQKDEISQKDLATLLGIGEPRMSQIINSDGNLHVATIARFFTALDFKVELLVTDADGKPLESKSRRRRSVTQTTTTYTHNIVAEDGELRRVFSKSLGGHRGTPVDFPLEHVTPVREASTDLFQIDKFYFDAQTQELIDA